MDIIICICIKMLLFNGVFWVDLVTFIIVQSINYWNWNGPKQNEKEKRSHSASLSVKSMLFTKNLEIIFHNRTGLNNQQLFLTSLKSFKMRHCLFVLILVILTCTFYDLLMFNWSINIFRLHRYSGYKHQDIIVVVSKNSFEIYHNHKSIFFLLIFYNLWNLIISLFILSKNPHAYRFTLKYIS